jgi:hypothetical protein
VLPFWHVAVHVTCSSCGDIAAAAVGDCLLQAAWCFCWSLRCCILWQPLTCSIAAIWVSRGRVQLHVILVIMQEVPQQLPVLLLGLLLLLLVLQLPQKPSNTPLAMALKPCP